MSTSRPAPRSSGQSLFSGHSFPEMYEQALVGPLFDPWVEPLFADVGLAPGDRLRVVGLVRAGQHLEHAAEIRELHEAGQHGDEDAEDDQQRNQRPAPGEVADQAEEVFQKAHGRAPPRAISTRASKPTRPIEQVSPKRPLDS